MSNFQQYRAVTRIHLPAPATGHLEAGETVFFDGSVLKRVDGAVVPIPYPTAINAAIKANWLVLEGSAVTTYQPKAAGVEVHAAQSKGQIREKVDVMTVASEDVDMGNRDDVRTRADVNRTEEAKSPKVEKQGDEGVVVGRLKTSAKAAAVEVGKDDQQIKASLEKTRPRFEVERPSAVVSTTGAKAGDDLDELLPEAASTGRPEAGVFKDDGVIVSSAGSAVGGQEDGEVVATVNSEAAASPQLDRNKQVLVKVLRQWVDTGKTWNGKVVNINELKLMAKAALERVDQAEAALAQAEVQLQEALEAQASGAAATDAPKVVAVVKKAAKAAAPEKKAAAPEKKAAAPKAEKKSAPKKTEPLIADQGLLWSTDAHWKSRQKLALEKYGNSAEALQRIIAQENSEAVISKLKARVAELSA